MSEEEAMFIGRLAWEKTAGETESHLEWGEIVGNRVDGNSIHNVERPWMWG